MLVLITEDWIRWCVGGVWATRKQREGTVCSELGRAVILKLNSVATHLCLRSSLILFFFVIKFNEF